MRISALLMVTIVFVGLSASVMAETPVQREPARPGLEIGRYQLFQGTYTTLDLKYRQASATHNAVFLLDTATGQVKRYVNRIDEDGRYIETWLPTDITLQLDMKKAAMPPLEGKAEK